MITNLSALLNKAGGKETSGLRATLLRALEKTFAMTSASDGLAQRLTWNDGILGFDGKAVVGGIERVFVIAIGISAENMMRTVVSKLDWRFEKGILVIPFDAAQPTGLSSKIEVLRANPYFFDGNGPRVYEKVKELVSKASGNDLFLYLLSPGSMTMLSSPVEGLSTGHLEELRFKLSHSPVSPLEKARIIKHLDNAKGGRIAALSPLPYHVTIVASDVSDNDYEVIGGGPTHPDPSTFKDIITILEDYNIWPQLSTELKHAFNKGLNNEYDDTLKPGARAFRRTKYFLLGNTRVFCDLLAEQLRAVRLNTIVLTHSFQVPANSIGRLAASFTRALGVQPPFAFILGGRFQTRGEIRGEAPAHEAAVFAIKKASKDRPNLMLFMNTSGKDGSAESSGVLVTGERAFELQQSQDRLIKLRSQESERMLEEYNMNIHMERGKVSFGDLTVILVGRDKPF